ncbi:unnamed protein product [Knipowitschia caucasica]
MCLCSDPELLLPVGLVLGSCLLLFLLCVSIYSLFKVDLVLWARGAFSTRKHSTATDGKLYDAYVAYPQSCAAGWTDQVETFALLTLPQVLEEACGYSLFIPGRDCLPGGAVIDSVEENLQASRRMLLLYSASTFSKKNCSNNNTLLSRPTVDHTKTYDQRTTKTTLNNNTEPQDLSSSQDHLQQMDNGQSISLKQLHTKAPQDMKGTDPQDMKGADPQSEPQSRGDTCGHTRTQMECVAAMHRALLERSLKVILVELEELAAPDVEQLPQSVRHLRQTQGAVCWWKTSRRARAPWRTRDMGDVETPLSSCVNPNSRFWKEVRYRMPI